MGGLKYYANLGHYIQIFDVKEILCHKKTSYQEITVIRRSLDNAKMLFIDGQEQSDELYADEFNSILVQPVTSNMTDVLIIGAGAGGPAKHLLQNQAFTGLITQIDVDAEMMTIAKEYLHEWHENSFDDPRVTNIFADINTYIEDCPSYDMIVFDLTDDITISKACWTESFFDKIIQKIKPGGVFSSHLCYMQQDHLAKLKLIPLNRFKNWKILSSEKALWKFFQGTLC